MKFDASSLWQFVLGLRLQATVAFAGKKSVGQFRRPQVSVQICSREFRYTDGFWKHYVCKVKVGVQITADGRHFRPRELVTILLGVEV